MYFIVFGVPSAIIFALLQVFACKKAKKKMQSFVPLLVAAAIVLAVPIIVLIEPLYVFLAEKFVWGFVAALVYSVIFGVAGIIGCGLGFAFYKIHKPKRT